MTCDGRVSIIVTWDIAFFLNSTCDIWENKRQGHAELLFLRIDM